LTSRLSYGTATSHFTIVERHPLHLVMAPCLATRVSAPTSTSSKWNLLRNM
jgi:hypothetical protein